jgi:hypothetical protein
VKRWARIALVVVGLTLALYATASLTGGWLGTPPWWWAGWRPVVSIAEFEHPTQPELAIGPDGVAHMTVTGWGTLTEKYGFHRRDGYIQYRVPGFRRLVSAAFIALGLVLFAWAAWPRRRRSTLSSVP